MRAFVGAADIDGEDMTVVLVEVGGAGLPPRGAPSLPPGRAAPPLDW